MIVESFDRFRRRKNMFCVVVVLVGEIVSHGIVSLQCLKPRMREAFSSFLFVIVFHSTIVLTFVAACFNVELTTVISVEVEVGKEEDEEEVMRRFSFTLLIFLSTSFEMFPWMVSLMIMNLLNSCSLYTDLR